MFLICLFFTYGLFHSVTQWYLNAQTTACYLGIFALATILIVAKQKRFPAGALVPGLLCIATALSFLLHHDMDLHDVLFLLLIPLSGIYCLVLTGANVHSFGSFYVLLDLIHCELLLPLKHLFAPITAFIDTITAHRAVKSDGKKRRSWLPVVIGVLVAVPVLLIVIPLLINSDAAFESVAGSAYHTIRSALGRIGQFLSEHFEFDVLDLLLSLLFAPYIYAVIFAFAGGIAKRENRDTSLKYRALQKAPLPFVSTVLGVVAAVYVIYLLTQSAYLFSAFTGHLPSGMSISVTEYARRGFFEMVKLAVVNFLLIAASVGFCKRKEHRLPNAVKGLDVFLCVFTILLCVTSIFKILMYIRSFGLTEKRLYVFAADLALIVCFAAMLLRLLKERFPYMKLMLGAVFLSAAALGLLGVNNTIAWYNSNGLLNGKLLTYSVQELAEDCGEAALPYLQKIAASDGKYAKQAKEVLKNSYSYYKAENELPAFQNIEQARVVRFIQAERENADYFTVEVNLDLAPEIYSLNCACLIDKEIVFSTGLQNADKSPMESTRLLSISLKDLPADADLSKFDMRFSVCLSPEDESAETPITSETTPLLKDVKPGGYYVLRVFETENGNLAIE